MLGEFLTTLNIVDKLSKYWKQLRGARDGASAETIPARFVRLFESHGVHRNQIPRFVGHGLTLKDMQDDDSLLAKLDEALLEAVCEKFAVRREWLDGAEEQVHPYHDFYKRPEKFASFIEGLKSKNKSAYFDGWVIAPKNAGFGDNALIIIQEPIGEVGEKPIYRYHLCNNWNFRYWKARAYLAACVALAWKNNMGLMGVYRSAKEIKALEWGETLLGWKGEDLPFGCIQWHTEDLALESDAFLKDVDPEIDNYGMIAGLGLWLELEKQGLMDTGIRKPPRDAFLQRFKTEGGKGIQ